MAEAPKEAVSFKALVVFLLAGLLLTAVILTIVFSPQGDTALPITLFVFLAAILGSAVNESSRIQRDLEGLRTFDRVVFLSWKLLVAIVFSMFLYLAFQSGIISGHVFPEFQHMDDAYNNMLDYMTCSRPKTNGDAALMFVWAFVAGYVERFVPNLIQKIQREK